MSQLAENFRAHREGLLAQGFWAVLVFRIGEPRRRVRNRVLRGSYFVFNRFLQKLIELTTGISIGESATIGRRFQIEHFGGVIIHGNTVIGDDVLIRQGVTLGNKSSRRPFDAPTIGNRVHIGAGAKVLGAVTVGDDAVIGANAVVLIDVPAGAVAVGVPAEIKPRRSALTA